MNYFLGEDHVQFVVHFAMSTLELNGIRHQFGHQISSFQGRGRGIILFGEGVGWER